MNLREKLMKKTKVVSVKVGFSFTHAEYEFGGEMLKKKTKGVILD